MNSQFKSAVKPYIKTIKLSHQQRVTRLYRHCLKTCLDWTWDRDLFIREATKIRKEFRNNSKLDPNSKYFLLIYRETLELIEKGEKELASWAYPEPYVCIF